MFGNLLTASVTTEAGVCLASPLYGASLVWMVGGTEIGLPRGELLIVTGDR